MPNKKLTDNEIVKALPKVLYGGHGCKNCKYDNGKGDDRCGLKGCKIARYALDLINRLQADCENYKQVAEHQQKLNLDKSFEIKRLKEEYPFKCKVGNNSEIHSKSIEDYDRLINDIQAEAYKEFAERLKGKAHKVLWVQIKR